MRIEEVEVERGCRMAADAHVERGMLDCVVGMMSVDTGGELGLRGVSGVGARFAANERRMTASEEVVMCHSNGREDGVEKSKRQRSPSAIESCWVRAFWRGRWGEVGQPRQMI